MKDLSIFDQISMPLETKKDAIKLGENNAIQLVKEGKEDLIKIYAQSARLEEMVKAYNKEIRKGIQSDLNGDKLEAYGIEFSIKNGSSRLNYSEDSVWKELKDKLTEREELLKTAEKSKEMIFDSAGVDVPKVSRIGGGEVLNVKY